MTTFQDTPHRDRTDDSSRLPWYDFSRLWSYNGFYNVVMGARGTGKTFGAKVKGIKDAIRKGHEFIYLRRYKEEIKFARDGFFADIVAENIFPDVVFKVDGNKGYWDWKQDADREGLEVPSSERDWKLCVHFHALSVSGQIKSQSFPNVKLVIYDEFVIEKGHIQYIPNEVKKFNDFYSTIDRYRGDTRVLMLSNSVSIMNPYFLAWDIEPQSNQDWMILFDGFLVVHFHKDDEFNQAVFRTPFGKFIEGTEYAEYAVGNEFADNNDLMLGNKTPDAVYRYTVETISGGSMSIWYDRDKMCWYAQRKRPKMENIYTLNPHNVSPHKTLWLNSDPLFSQVKSAFRHGRLFFDTAQTRNAFRELL